jgi:cytochrome bd ubiquinol oxidase subunit II
MATEILPLLWAGIIAFAVAMYVLMDGFDLGIGILFRTAEDETERDAMMNTVAPIWDGNETWLVLGGAGLFGAFPVAYATILPAMYLPLIVMLVALIFRGVAFEFRFKAETSRPVWSLAFGLGSIVATFAQGIVLGALVQGIDSAGGQFTGGVFDWLTPFSIVTGLALVAGYALLGSTWLVMKTEGALQRRARRLSIRLLVLVVGFMAVVSVWVPFLGTSIEERWFSWPNIAYLSPVPLLVAAASLALHRSVRGDGEVLPFALAMALFLLGFAGLAISLYPLIVPPDVTIWQAASPPESQIFLLVGVAFLIPLILAYTAWSYWVFRGKVGADAGYH